MKTYNMAYTGDAAYEASGQRVIFAPGLTSIRYRVESRAGSGRWRTVMRGYLLTPRFDEPRFNYERAAEIILGVGGAVA